MIDAVDQLFPDETRNNLLFIPDELSDNLRFVITCLPETPIKKDSFIEIKPIQKNERRSIINSILTAYNRELSEKVIEKILDKPSSDNPLYLSLLVQRMTMMNKEDFDQIVKMGDGMDAIIRYQRQIMMLFLREMNRSRKYCFG